MSAPPPPRIPRYLRVIAWVVALLMAVRFSSSTMLAGSDLGASDLLVAGKALEAYELFLPFVLIPVVYLLLGRREPQLPFVVKLAVVGLLGASLATWLLSILAVGVPLTTAAFLVLAVASVAAESVAAYRLPTAAWDGMRPWVQAAYPVLLVLVPIVFVMRVAALEGFAPVGSGPIVRGNWFFVNLPTVALEFLALGVFLNVLFDRTRAELEARWLGFVPLILAPLALAAIVIQPLSGYILSALISWGANLSLFAPAGYSVGLAIAVLACFASALLFLGRRGREGPWDLLLLGTASILLAGFYPSMVSVAGLGVALLMTSEALGTWRSGAV